MASYEILLSFAAFDNDWAVDQITLFDAYLLFLKAHLLEWGHPLYEWKYKIDVYKIVKSDKTARPVIKFQGTM